MAILPLVLRTGHHRLLVMNPHAPSGHILQFQLVRPLALTSVSSGQVLPLTTGIAIAWILARRTVQIQKGTRLNIVPRI